MRSTENSGPLLPWRRKVPYCAVKRPRTDSEIPPWEAMPQGFLNTAVDRLIEDVSIEVFGKRKRMLKPGDNITLDG
jgi:hypothetical protein